MLEPDGRVIPGLFAAGEGAGAPFFPTTSADESRKRSAWPWAHRPTGHHAPPGGQHDQVRARTGHPAQVWRAGSGCCARPAVSAVSRSWGMIFPGSWTSRSLPAEVTKPPGHPWVGRNHPDRYVGFAAHQQSVLQRQIGDRLLQRAGSQLAKFVWTAYRKKGTYTHSGKRARPENRGKTVFTNARPRRHVARLALFGASTGTRKERMERTTFVKMHGHPWIDLDSGIYDRAWDGEMVPDNKRADPLRLPDRILAHCRRWHRMGAMYLIERPTKKEGNKPPEPIENSFFRHLREMIPDKAERKGLNIHALKHTCATWLCVAGVPMHEIADYLSTDQQTIKEVYFQEFLPDHGGVVERSMGHAGRPPRCGTRRPRRGASPPPATPPSQHESGPCHPRLMKLPKRPTSPSPSWTARRTRDWPLCASRSSGRRTPGEPGRGPRGRGRREGRSMNAGRTSPRFPTETTGITGNERAPTPKKIKENQPFA